MRLETTACGFGDTETSESDGGGYVRGGVNGASGRWKISTAGTVILEVAPPSSMAGDS